MTEEQIISLWRSGLSKYKVAEIYKRTCNQQIRIMRLEPHNRNRGRLISSYEALAMIEKIILKHMMEGNNKW